MTCWAADQKTGPHVAPATPNPTYVDAYGLLNGLLIPLTIHLSGAEMSPYTRQQHHTQLTISKAITA